MAGASRVALGTWKPGAPPRQGAQAFAEALAQLHRPLCVVAQNGHAAIAVDGTPLLGQTVTADALPLLAYTPPLTPDALGDATFRHTHGVRFAYVAGEMANGIASEALVEASARAGMLGVFGAAGLPLPRVEAALDRLAAALSGMPWGANLIHSPDDPALEAAVAALFIRKGLRFVSASAYLDLTLPVVRYRLTGIHRAEDGSVVTPNRLMAKVSRVEVATKFLSPAPQSFIEQLVADGTLTAEQAHWARTVPLADDVTAEADSGGHTDNRPLVVLLPALLALRDRLATEYRYAVAPRIGAAGGIATPASLASAFAMGAAYVVVGSVNQATREAGTSDAVREMLAQAASTDVAMAPAADMFEMGVKVQVLSRGTLFAVRAQRLYELYRTYDSLSALPPAVRVELEQKYFRCTLEQAWQGCVQFFTKRDPSQLTRAAKEPKHQLALLFRSYLGQASHWANDGVADRRLDYQIWCGPAMGAFNDWVKGSTLEPWQQRHAVVIAKNLLVGAAVLTRAAALRAQGVALPAEAEQFRPRTEDALDVLLAARPATIGIEAAPAPTQPTEEPIAIIGLGTLFPQAPDVTRFWQLLRTGIDAVGDVPATHWTLADFHDANPSTPDKTYATRGAFLPTTPFDPTQFGIPPAVLEATDTSQLLGLWVARMAMEDAGYGDATPWDKSRASVILGVTGTQELVISLGARLGHPKWRRALADAGVDSATADDVVQRISESYVGWQENSFPGLLGNVVAGRIANRLDFGGTNCIIDAACASSLGAIHLAMLELRSKKADVVLSGGVDCLNDIFMHMCFSKTPALSPTGDARPFSDFADGTLLGEGLGMVVLKRLSDAQRDGDRVYAVITAMGTSSDGRAKSIYAPLPKGQARALRDAYQQARVTPRDIGLLEAHGTGTKAGDAAEFEALSNVYREASSDGPWCLLGSVKSQIGHTKSAAGAAGIIKAALALWHKVLPPTLKVERPNPAMNLESSPFAIGTTARPWLKRGHAKRRAAVSSFGFGGSNFHAVLEEVSASRAAPAWDDSVQLLAFSAPTAATLLTAIAAEVAAFSASHAHRLVVVAAASIDRAALLKKCVQRIQSAPQQAFELPEGAAYGVGPAAGSLAFLFPGQGSQYVDMGRDLATVFPEMLEAFEAAGAVGTALSPLPSFDAATKAAREAALTKTDVAQPALGAMARGLLQVLRRFGVEPAAVAGHSYGELVALHAAGVFNADTLREMSLLRGQLMAGNGVDRGTMLAVLAPLTDVEQLIRTEGLSVVLANRNSPTQGVLSGSRDAIALAEATCKAKGLRTARLNVGAAFHSPLVAQAAKTFRQGIEELAFSSPRLPVIANATAAPYPATAAAIKEQLSAQLAMPVRFDEVVARLHADGARTFVEVGPKSTLTGLVKATLGDKSHSAFAIDGSKGLFDLAWALARIAADGHHVDLRQWNALPLPPRTTQPIRRVNKMTVPLSGANYRAPFTPRPKRVPQPVMVQAVVAAPTASPVLERVQALHEETARLHQLFLEGQQAALQRLMSAPSVTQDLVSKPQPVARPAPRVVAPTTVTSTPAIATDFTEVILSVVAETTGYPRETLSLDMDMEADLGIDSIKRVEILSLVTKRVPGMPAVQPEKLSGLRTLRQVTQLVPTTAAAVKQSAPTDFTEVILSVVAETTGYPRETLSLDMDMEADLGIDSIKRVEILSLVTKRVPGMPAVQPEKLAGLRTLRQVTQLVPTTAVAVKQSAPTDFIEVILSVVAETTGYPRETLSLDMDMEADLGIDSIKRVEILSLVTKRVPGMPAVQPEKLATLRTLHQVVQLNQPEATPPAPPIERRLVVPTRVLPGTPRTLAKAPIAVLRDETGLAAAVVNALRERGVEGRLVSTSETFTGALGGLILTPIESDWNDAGEKQIKQLFTLAKKAAAWLRATPKSIFITTSQRDGAFGFALPSPQPLAQAPAGLSKTLHHEWPEVSCRHIDVASSLSLAEAAERIVDELTGEGPTEIGIGPLGRMGLGLLSQAPTPSTHALSRGDVVIVTGGARGVTATCAQALGKATGVTLALLGRTPVPTAEAPWLASATDEAAIKRALLEHAEGSTRPTPKVLGDQCRAVLAAREVRHTLNTLAAAGVSAHYLVCDVRDSQAVSTMLSQARTFGSIRGLLHGAGVLRDKRLEDKRDEDLDAVIDTKVASLRVLLQALTNENLKLLALFTSVSGRFGRRGQSDYAVANQALVSIAQQQAALRPNCRVVALDWGPWDGGMVTPALKAEFAREGVSLVGREAGAAAFVAEALSTPSPAVEVVLGSGFGPIAPVTWHLASAIQLSPTAPALAQHQLAGKAVVPFALMLEWFASAAGERVHTLHDARVLRGITLDKPTTVAMWLGARDGSRQPVELRGADGAVHARAVLVFGAAPSSPTPVTAGGTTRSYPHTLQHAYAELLFHGPALHAIEAVDSVGEGGMALRLTSHPSSEHLWSGPRRDWAIDPLALDGVFQALILWCREQCGAPSLPSRIGALTMYRPLSSKLNASVRITSVEGATVTSTIDLLDEAGMVAVRIEDYVCIVSPTLDRAFSANGAASHLTLPEA